MSENVTRQAVQEGTSAPADQPTPTITHYQQVATQLSAAITELVAQIPRFESAHPLTSKSVRVGRNVTSEFIATVLAAVEANPELQRTEKFDVTEARDTLQFLEAFKPLLDRIEALVRDLKFTMDARKAKVSADSLQLYAIAKGISRDPRSTLVAAHVRNMKRDLGLTRPKSRSTPPAFGLAA